MSGGSVLHNINQNRIKKEKDREVQEQRNVSTNQANGGKKGRIKFVPTKLVMLIRTGKMIAM